MKVKMTGEMKNKVWLAAVIIFVAISIFFCFYRFDVLFGLFKKVLSLTTPFIIGFAIAFLLNKPMILIEEKLFLHLPLKKNHKRAFAALLAIILGIVAVSCFLALLIPQLIDSILSLISSFPEYMENFEVFVQDFIKEHGIRAEEVGNYFEQIDIFGKMTDFVTVALPQMLKYTYAFGSTLLDIVLGIVSALYMLMDKERLLCYVRKINYALFPEEVSKYFHRMSLLSSKIFNNFIVGKAIDSLIIGILCYVGSLIFQFPYALLLSVFVGVTNMIPVFGPFIGAIPGVVILFIIHPITAVYFALFVFALQQFDGNVLGPMILGDKLGLPSIGILFSVCIGGGLFGIVGMFIGVPCFAVFYVAVKEFVHYRLEKKGVDASESDVVSLENNTN